MILNFLYMLTFIVPFPFWVLMIFAPHAPLTKRVVSSYAIFIALGLYYVCILIGIGAVGFGGSLSDFTTTEGLAKLMGTPLAALVVWSHMTIMDLIGGHWMYHEAQRLNAPRLIAGVCLLFTLLSGPVGLLLFMFWRTLHTMRQTERPDHAV